jgi:pimeloyl-ACP methyl ester carboxylesterase
MVIKSRGAAVSLVVLGVVAASRAAVAGEEPAYAWKATGFDEAILASDDRIAVREAAGYWLFEPKADAKATALAFCPGGLVDPTAYAPMARALAGRGYPTYIVKLDPRPRSIDDQKRDGVSMIKSVIEGKAARGRWVVGGHSLGGAIAARCAREHPASLDGLLLCGTTHPRDFDLSGFDRPVTKVYATRDAVATAEQVRRNEKLLPAHTRWVAVEGGNHAQFGWYGPQPGDRAATIGREEQQAIVVEAIAALLDQVSNAAKP